MSTLHAPSRADRRELERLQRRWQSVASQIEELIARARAEGRETLTRDEARWTLGVIRDVIEPTQRLAGRLHIPIEGLDAHAAAMRALANGAEGGRSGR